VGQDGGSSKSDLGRVKTGIFLREGLDTLITKLPVGQISGWSCLNNGKSFCKGTGGRPKSASIALTLIHGGSNYIDAAARAAKQIVGQR
jgi:hypothetical protein